MIVIPLQISDQTILTGRAIISQIRGSEVSPPTWRNARDLKREPKNPTHVGFFVGPFCYN